MKRFKEFKTINETSEEVLFPNRKEEIRTLGTNFIETNGNGEEDITEQMLSIIDAASMDGALMMMKYIQENPKAAMVLDSMMSSMDKDIKKILDKFYGENFGF